MNSLPLLPLNTELSWYTSCSDSVCTVDLQVSEITICPDIYIQADCAFAVRTVLQSADFEYFLPVNIKQALISCYFRPDMAPPVQCNTACTAFISADAKLAEIGEGITRIREILTAVGFANRVRTAFSVCGTDIERFKLTVIITRPKDDPDKASSRATPYATFQ